ncbi:MAG: hypothetical protein HC875_20525 [Anaerolineales bacterium]|nr:hypothetical protein [Anaerolineales bacterium]
MISCIFRSSGGAPKEKIKTSSVNFIGRKLAKRNPVVLDFFQIHSYLNISKLEEIKIEVNG